MEFYLGTHETAWLGRDPRLPLFVSHVRLAKRRTLPQATHPWALDSGGFTQLSQHGHWTITPRQYVTAVRRYHDEIGHLAWAAPQDWMCEPFVLERTGLTIAEHQRRTVTNYIQLRCYAPDLPFIPVLQGWTRDDYLRCVDWYDSSGIPLERLPRVGVGTICRRQDTGQADTIIRSLAPLRLHGFGVKVTGLLQFGHRLTSADSLAWSYNARKHPPIDGHTHGSCANCLTWASRWRDSLLTRLDAKNRHGIQGDLFDPDEAWAS